MSNTYLHKLKQVGLSIRDHPRVAISATQVSGEIKKEFRKLDALAKTAVTTKVKDAMVDVAGPVLEAVKAKTPVYHKDIKRYLKSGRLAAVYEPGNLRKSMKIFKGELNTTNAPAIFVGPETERDVGRELEDDGWYAFFITRGTSKMEPNNFINRAQREQTPYIKKTIGKAAANAVEKEIKKGL